MSKHQALKITVEISTSILYPWEIGDYFRYNGQKYRIEKIICETKQASVDGAIVQLSADTPINDRIITSLVVGTLIR